MYMFGSGVVGLTVGIEDHTVICDQSKALRRAHREELHPTFSHLSVQRSGEGFNMELNT